MLHHGPILVTLEAAAIAAAGEARVESLDLRIVRAGKTGPFTTSAEVLCDESNCVLVRSEMHQADSNKTLVATATVRLRHD